LQLAAAQALDQRWQTEHEARPGNFTLTSFVTQLRCECKNDIDADFYKDGITKRGQKPETPEAQRRPRQRRE
jgi:hypothetical protein